MENNNIEFFDGETINNNYVLLGCSNKYIWKDRGLNCKDCLDFLYNNRSKYNYFFRIDYDINMIFKDIDKNEVINLFEGNEIFLFNYKIQYYRHKIFMINNIKYYDIFSFTNKSFEKTLEIFKIKFTETEKNLLHTEKLNRNKFNLKDKNKIIEYNKLENNLGKKLINEIYNILPNELKTYSFYGSSSLSQKYLKNKKLDINDLIFNNEIFESAYFGGRMEALKIGTFENCFKYDLNSAYPSVINNLRKPLGIELKNFNGKIKETNLYYLDFNILEKDKIGLLPIRLKNGYLVFPDFGSGWFYGGEIIEALKRTWFDCKIKKEIDIKLGEKLFNNDIENFYKLRLNYKLNNDVKEYIYKILLNSIYGKFAQNIGKPKFRNLYLAGFITASIRAKLLEAIKDFDSEIIFFATDCILSKNKLNLKISNKLGDYDYKEIKKAIILLSGIYQLTDYNDKNYFGERGYKLDFNKVYKDILKNGKSEIKTNIFISNIYAYKNHKTFLNNKCKFTEIKKTLDIKSQHKRIFLTFNIEKENNSFLLSKTELKNLNKITENIYNNELNKIDFFDNNLNIV